MTKENLEKGIELRAQIEDIEDQESYFADFAAGLNEEDISIEIKIESTELAFGDKHLVKLLHSAVMKTVKQRKATLSKQFAKL